MTRLLASRVLCAVRLATLITAALLTPQASHALDLPPQVREACNMLRTLGESHPPLASLGDTSCGQLGQPACTIASPEWWETGTETGCDRGLKTEPRWSGWFWLLYCTNDSRQSASVSDGTSRALRLQRELQADLPINQLTVLGGHNAFNSVKDGYDIYFAEDLIDGSVSPANQQYSITDQLRMGVRSLSLDVHWFYGALRLCHADGEHCGCSPKDRPFFLIIEELSQWLSSPENIQEVVFLELEPYLDGHDDELVAPINAYLGDLVFRPSMMPADGSQPTLNDIRAKGKRLVITGLEDAGHNLFINAQRLPSQPSWPATFVKNFVASTCSYDINGSIINASPTSRDATVRYAVSEDSTVYSTYYNGPEVAGVITNEKLQELTACDITGITLDQVTPDKIQHAVWSWNVNEPKTGNSENCAELGSNGRWSAISCGTVRRFACRNKNNRYDWRVTTAAFEWERGEVQCASEHPDYLFDVPLTGYENQKLAAAAQGQSVWLNLHDNDVDGVWRGIGTKPRKVELRSLGKCMSDSSGRASTGANILLGDCNGGSNQKWLLPGDGTIRSALDINKCLDLANSNTNNGTSILLWDCHRGGNQKWMSSGGFLRSALNRNKVVDVYGGHTANGTKVQIWDYHGGVNQQWTQVPEASQ